MTVPVVDRGGIPVADRPDWRWRSWDERDPGRIPVLIALVLIALVFQALNGAYLSADNLVNLALQASTTGILTLGVVLVLMVGQIDLSVGAVSGVAAAVVTVGFVRAGWPLIVAVLVAVAVGTALGAGYGWMFARLGVPSFVITLSGLMVGVGLQAQVLGPTASVNLPYESGLVRFAQQTFLPPVLSAGLVVAVVLAYTTSRLVDRRRRIAAELSAPSLGATAARIAALAAGLGVPVWYLSRGRGVGAIVAVFIGLVWATDIVLRRTQWGRSVRAIGSSVESARLAGFPVRRVYIAAFMACAGLAALAGVLSAGRFAAANQSTGGADLTLTAIAAAVIGGTSLFGGRGSAWSAVLGVAVIHAISSGLTLLTADGSLRYIVTGVVLALAVTVDAVSRRSRGVPGR
ncbi:sugar ABC transporter permease [Actinotalea fermentans]|uniref:Xylose transport system permease protein XylH n=1 Tax=Actinotalea fermentans TaxID=43671 RepID=A0A511YZW8_9CELL|nr:sugar ABC transporter permease [Actinotalea fermentans]KGM16872.1 ABC transporter permease [Actinotalea fermentans ATCC 43279 = JCM 9966 = DSM 3133]GEN80729.1 ABC transporter permease [Actinotalea fermentans]